MGSSLGERVAQITEVVRTEAATIEAERRVSQPVVDAIRGTRLNRALLPTDLGGTTVPLPEVAAAVELIASMDGSAGWCAAIGAGSNLFAGYMASGAAKEVFADPDQGNASVFAPFGNARLTDDGYELSGRWPFTSNCLHSEWVGVGAFFWSDPDQAEPIPRIVFVRRDDLEIEDTWTSPGLSGTGSHHTSVEKLIVDRDRSLTFLDKAWADDPVFRLPILPVLAPVLGVVPLGIARGALDVIRTKIAEGGGGTRGSLADDSVALAAYASARADLHAARAGLMASLGAMWDLALAEQSVSKVVQGEVLMAMNRGCEVAVEVTATAHRLGGGSAVYAGSTLLRSLRDVEAARQHMMFGHGHRPMLAKAMAGLDVFDPPFII